MLKQYHYDQDKNLTGLFVQSGNAILANNRYLYDGNGNRTHKKQLGDETLYHYDPLNQLQKVQYPGYTEELFYDKAGNRTRRIMKMLPISSGLKSASLVLRLTHTPSA